MTSMNRHRKRYQPQEEELIVDDLQIAAQYAAAAAPPTAVLTSDNDDENEISLEDAESGKIDEPNETEESNKSESHRSGGEVSANQDDTRSKNSKDEDKTQEVSDDESEADLADQLARMQHEDYHANSGVEQPRTAHEIDAYAAAPPVDTAASIPVSLENSSVDFAAHCTCGGHVKHHMGRTVVVLSQPGSILKEGSLLVLLLADSEMVPLGRILEVFGPVSRPLYSIRLPDGDSEKNKSASKNERETEHIASEAKKCVTTTQKSDVSGDEVTDLAPNGMKRPTVDDPWSESGNLTKLLRENPNFPVHFLNDHALENVMNPAMIDQMSGKGCDASNLYDEEVMNTHEMDFSDDEEERAAKGRQRRGESGRGRRQSSHSRWTMGRHHPNGHHTPQPSGFVSSPRGFYGTHELPPYPREPAGFYAPKQGYYEPQPQPQHQGQPLPGPAGFWSQPSVSQPVAQKLPHPTGQSDTVYYNLD